MQIYCRKYIYFTYMCHSRKTNNYFELISLTELKNIFDF